MKEDQNSKMNEAVKEVSRILEENPGLFREHPGLLEYVDIQDSQNEGVASLFEKQAEVLRNRIDEINQSTAGMVKAARENELISDRLFDVIWELLSARDLESLLSTLYASLSEKFNIERATLRVAGKSDSPGIAEVDPSHADSEAYSDAMSMIRNHSHCDARLPILLHQYLFGEVEENIESVALIPLLASPAEATPIGLLALGSTTRQQFQPGLGTLHLDRLGIVLGTCIRKHLEP